MGQTYIRESPGGGCATRRIGARACARHDHVVTQQLCAGRSASRRYFVAVHLQLFFSLRGLSALSTVLSTLPGHSERAALVFRLASRPPAFLTPPLLAPPSLPPSLHPPPHTPATPMATPEAPDTPDGLFTPEQLSWLQARLPLPASDALPGPSTASAPFPPAPTTPASGECGMGISERTALACTVVKVRNFTRSLVRAIPRS